MLNRPLRVRTAGGAPLLLLLLPRVLPGRCKRDSRRLLCRATPKVEEEEEEPEEERSMFSFSPGTEPMALFQVRFLEEEDGAIPPLPPPAAAGFLLPSSSSGRSRERGPPVLLLLLLAVVEERMVARRVE